jgi:1-deoxy-D-xylulose-5-phosphate reductoisomerase
MVQASPPDMRLPIAVALGWPDRIPGAAAPCDWTTAASWEFEPLDDAAFPAVQLAREAGSRGGTVPAVFNAANEVCVQAFRDGRLPFLGIVDTVARVVTEHDVLSYQELSIDDVLAADAWARARARELTGVQETTQA